MMNEEASRFQLIIPHSSFLIPHFVRVSAVSLPRALPKIDLADYRAGWFVVPRRASMLF
jgi:hypothetical protein